jgi:hypothetical protein
LETLALAADALPVLPRFKRARFSRFSFLSGATAKLLITTGPWKLFVVNDWLVDVDEALRADVDTGLWVVSTCRRVDKGATSASDALFDDSSELKKRSSGVV